MNNRRSIWAFVIAHLSIPVGLVTALKTGSLHDMAAVTVAMLAVAFILEFGPRRFS